MPENGGLIPASCHNGEREFGQRCVSYCKHGYKRRGPAVKYCESNKKWSTDAEMICIPSMTFNFLNSELIIFLYLILMFSGR